MTAGDAPVRLVADLGALVRDRARWRREGRTVVWTNGCFDLFHAGHTFLLESARSLGDVLVVGLSSDESIRRLKGADRPYMSFADRAVVLRGMRAVDHVVALRDDLPIPEIALLRPDICCKDDTYAVLPLPERATVEGYGGRMVLIPRRSGLSTTLLAARLRGGPAGAGS